MDQVAHKLLSKTFAHAEANAEALRTMYDRIAAAARKTRDGGTVTYAELVADLTFRAGARSFRITAKGFTPNNRRFVSGMLGHLSKQTYLHGGFFAGAMVVDKKTRRPGALFFRFARELGALQQNGTDAEEQFWKGERKKAHDFYTRVRADDSRPPSQLPEFLSRDEEGFIRLSGHRVGLTHLIHYYQQGYSAEMLKEQFPTVPLSLVHKTLAFYLEGQEWIDRYVSAERERVQEQRSTAAKSPPSLDELRRRYERSRRPQAV